MDLNRTTGLPKHYFGLFGFLVTVCISSTWLSADDNSKKPAAEEAPAAEPKSRLVPLSPAHLKIAQSKSQAIQDLCGKRAAAVNYKPLSVPIVKEALTQQATHERYLQFRLRELEAYKSLTSDPPQAKTAGTKFIDAYLRYVVNTDANSNSLKEVNALGKVAVEAGSKDPLLLAYQRSIQWEVLQDHAEAESAWLTILNELQQTKYPRAVELYVRYFLRDIDHARNGDPRYSKKPYPIPVATIVQWLEQEGTNSPWRESVCERLWTLWKKANMHERLDILNAVGASKEIDEYFVHVLAGELNYQLAWSYRGNGYADTVTREKWQRFGYYSAHAAEHWKYAWFLHPELPLAPGCLIGVALTASGTEETPQFWFHRTVEANFDHYDAYSRMLLALLPRWGGSHRSMFEFAKNCVETERFETVVPYIAVEMLKELRDREMVDLSEQPSAARLLRDFATRREAYRKRLPNSRLYEDNGAYRSDIVVLMEQSQLPDLAAAELRSAGTQLNWTRLRHNGRPGRYLATRLMATQGALGQRVLPFDEKLRQPWDANIDAGQLKWLTDECQALKDLVPAGDPAEAYLSHAAVILKQLRQFSTGDWAEMPIDRELTGWEPYTESWSYDSGAVDLISWVGGEANQANLRPLANFQPPLEIEATFELRDPYPWIDNPGIGWSREGSIGDLYPLRKKAIKFAIESSVSPVDGKLARRDFVHNQGLPSSTDRYPLKTTGPHRLRLKLWNQSAEFSVDDTIWSTTQLSQPWDRQGFLCLGSNLDLPQAGTLRLSEIRIRNLGGAPPPADSEPLDVRSKYWEDRQTTVSGDDPVTMAKLCRIRFDQKRFEDVLSLAKELQDKHPGMNDISVWKARALLEYRHDEAGALAELQANRSYEARDDVEVMSIIAEIMSMAQDKSLRNGKKALSLAQDSFKASRSTHARSLAAQAAAEAELGDSKAATSTLTKALELATESEKQEWEPRLMTYKAGKPYHFPANP